MGVEANCCLCSQIAGWRDGDLISQLLGESSYVRRTLLDGQFFAAIPSLGPIAPGHLLVCPKAHVKSLGSLLGAVSLCDSLREELDATVYLLRSLLRRLFRAPVHLFEHGSASMGNSRVLCTVDHAHLHLLPANVDVLSVLLSDSRWRLIEGGLETVAELSRGREYLYYQSPSGETLLATATQDFPSQYLRQLFWAALGRTGEWNWRLQPDPNKVDSLFKFLAEALTHGFGQVA